MSDPILLAELAAGDPLRRRTALEHLAATTTRLDGALVAAVVACLATPLKAVQRCAADVLSLVEAGARQVAFEFRPWSLRAGGLISIFGLAFIVCRFALAVHGQARWIDSGQGSQTSCRAPQSTKS